MYNLLIFDVDGTLVSDYNCKALFPHVVEFFSKLPRPGPDIALATNQGGVGLRYWMEKGGFGEPRKFPTQQDARSRILKIAASIASLYRFPSVYISWIYQSKSSLKWGPVPQRYQGDLEWSVDFRKPNSGMITAAMNARATPPNQTLVIGDRETDLQAGKSVGCDTIMAVDFFNAPT